MAVNSPIKDIKIIEKIKELYEKKGLIRDLLLFTLAINTGMNLLDLLKLNVGDVRGKFYLNFETTKSIPITEEMKNLINKVISDRADDAPLFISIRGHRIERSYVFNSFKDICKELGIAGKYSVASWRKTFAYHYYQKYHDLSYLQWLFNQSSIKLTLQFIDEYENMNLRFREGVCL